jgi:hypothetical protein
VYEGLGYSFDDVLREFTIGMGCESYLNVQALSNGRNTAGPNQSKTLRTETMEERYKGHKIQGCVSRRCTSHPGREAAALLSRFFSLGDYCVTGESKDDRSQAKRGMIVPFATPGADSEGRGTTTWPMA